MVFGSILEGVGESVPSLPIFSPSLNNPHPLAEWVSHSKASLEDLSVGKGVSGQKCGRGLGKT